LLTYSGPLFLKQQCDRTLGDSGGRAGAAARPEGFRGVVVRRSARRRSEKDAKLAQKSGQLQPFITVFPPECMGQLASFGPT
jgi:hypothetical protein